MNQVSSYPVWHQGRVEGMAHIATHLRRLSSKQRSAALRFVADQGQALFAREVLIADGLQVDIETARGDHVLFVAASASNTEASRVCNLVVDVFWNVKPAV
jgi:hypothetical protein